MVVTYNPWPIGNVPKWLQRPELEELRQAGYHFGDAREVIDIFERKVALFAGSRYAVAVDCCTHAIELAMLWKLERGEINICSNVAIPENTYVSIPMVLIKCGLMVQFTQEAWRGMYQLMCAGPTVVYDAAVRWKMDMYVPGSLMCLSFQIKKRIPIGRGGMILTDSEEAYEWLKMVRYDGRDMSLPYNHVEHVKHYGYHYYMTPEDAARGILLMDSIKEEGDSGGHENYPNLRPWLKL